MKHGCLISKSLITQLIQTIFYNFRSFDKPLPSYPLNQCNMWTKIQLLCCCLFCALSMEAQVLDFIDIHLTILEKNGSETKVMSNAELMISDQGKVQTDMNGSFQYTYPVRNAVEPEISIQLLSEKHKMLKPLDGAILIDPTREKMFIEFVVVNMDNASESFKRKISTLEKQVNALRQKNELTRKQVSNLNTTLLDTILYYEAVRSSMEYRIDDLEALTDDQQQTIMTQRQRIDSLEEQVTRLSADLSQALEERYLRQNEYFKAISTNFAQYIRSVNDVTEHLGFIKTYSSSGDFRSLDRDLRLYEEAFVAISDQHQDHISGVSRYWNNPKTAKELEAIYELLLKGIHLNQVRPTFNEIIDHIQKQKPGKAQKLATKSRQDIVLNIRDLEMQINQILIKLRNT